MNVVPLSIARVTNQLQSALLYGNLTGEQLDLMKVQQQISTGDRLSAASDDPAAAVGIQGINRQIDANTQFTTNLAFAGNFLNTADSALGSVSGMLNQATSIASSQIGVTSTPDQRAADAQIINSMLQQTLSLSNTRYQDASVFGGANTARDAFVSKNGGFYYQGSTQSQSILTNDGKTIDYTVDGSAVFGGLSSQVTGSQNLSPELVGTTRLLDVGGAAGNGIRAGSITLAVGGGAAVTVDLSKAATMADVQTSINNALSAAGTTASVSFTGDHLTVTGDATQAIVIADATGSATASDLGITGTVAAAGTLAGAGLSPKITLTTPLSALNNGTGIDPAGLVISNGARTATVSFAGAVTVQDMLNKINGAGVSVNAHINAAGTGIDIQNALSGSPLTIGENGGTTAHQLGIRSLDLSTKLADLNNGQGVTPIANTALGATGNVTVTNTTGGTFNVNVDGITTVAGLIAAINAAPGHGTVTASANPSGNGITLTDSASGPGKISVAAAPDYVSNGTNLGLFGTGSGNTLVGGNVAFSTDDFQITRKDGTSFSVSLKGAQNVQDVLNDINNAAGNAGANKVTAALNANGNGIRLSDASTGPGALAVTALNNSSAAAQLGIDQTAGGATPGSITGRDVNPINTRGVFSDLTMLRDALLNNDDAAITRAAQLLDADAKNVTQQRGIVGARVQDIEARKSDVNDSQTQLKQSLSLLKDTDLNEAITRYTTLQTALQATMQASKNTQNLSLMDFLK